MVSLYTNIQFVCPVYFGHHIEGLAFSKTYVFATVNFYPN